MRGSRAWLLLLPLCLLSACAGVDVDIEYDPDADFSGFRRYAWKLGGQQVLGRSILDKGEVQEKLQALIDDELSRNGFLRASAESADFLVGYHVARVSRQTTKGYKDYELLGRRWRVIKKRKYHEGSLIIDILDPVKSELLWRGTARAALDPDSNPDDNREIAREAVARLLERFPPK